MLNFVVHLVGMIWFEYRVLRRIFGPKREAEEIT
jgi:hypothetical protein